MRSSSVALLFLLGVAMASRLSLADARGMSRSGTSIADMVGQELRGLVARADNMFRSAAGWHTTAESKNMRAVAAARRRDRKSAGGARCVTAAMCRKRRVICGQRCYAAARTSVNHAPRCVVKCKMCVPTC
jgi:hypothetical protein